MEARVNASEEGVEHWLLILAAILYVVRKTVTTDLAAVQLESSSPMKADNVAPNSRKDRKAVVLVIHPALFFSRQSTRARQAQAV